MIRLSPRRRWRRRQPRRVNILGSAALGLLCLAASLTPTPMLIWNASASAPIGLYRRVTGDLHRGDLVLARLPAGARELAAERGYLPASVPLVKRIAGIAGDTVCANSASIFLNGRFIATRLQQDREIRNLPAWEGCKLLQPGDFFLLMPDVPDSYDSRYFGPISRHLIIGRLVPVWTR